MSFRNLVTAVLCTLGLFAGALGPQPVKAADKAQSVRQQARAAAERGLEFLQKDAAEWRTTRKCASCHQGTMTVFALAEAKRQGYAIPATALKEAADWNRERLAGLDAPRTTGPFSSINTGALYTALIAVLVPHQEAVSPLEFRQITEHLRRYQETDGEWLWSGIPAKNRPPPVFESDELATLLVDIALAGYEPAEDAEKAVVKESRARAATWLEQHHASETAQFRAFRLLRDVRAGKPQKEVKAQVDALLTLQNPDGGWSPEKELPSDAYATGLVLYALTETRVKPEREEVRKAVEFLLRNQEPNGSWFVTPRCHPGEKPFSNPSPIGYYGSAWSTMALMRIAPQVAAERSSRK